MRVTNCLLYLVVLGICGNCNEKSPELCLERPKEDCGCYTNYLPVCGCNEKTYSNACQAECNGITRFTEGTCPDKK
jgi:hypothetical protein